MFHSQRCIVLQRKIGALSQVANEPSIHIQATSLGAEIERVSCGVVDDKFSGVGYGACGCEGEEGSGEGEEDG
jgi:hypothetical protein